MAFENLQARLNTSVERHVTNCDVVLQGGRSCRGIFDAKAERFVDGVFQSVTPRLQIRDVECAEVGQGTQLAVGLTPYEVAGQPEPDGRGWVHLWLFKGRAS